MVSGGADFYLMMKASCWDHFEHEADIGVRATAHSRETLFERLAEALTAIITEPGSIQSAETIAIRCEAPDDAMLLVDWLNALIYEMATRRMLFGDISPSSKSKAQRIQHYLSNRTSRACGTGSAWWMYRP